MSNNLLKQSLNEERQRRKQGISATLEKLYNLLSPKQRAFFDDPSRFKIARAGRRGGKSFVDAIYLILVCLKAPNTPVLYAGLTRDSAKEIIWPILTALLNKFKIAHDAKPSALKIYFPNGSTITVFGCDTPNARDRLRGRKFKLVIFDETGFFRQLDTLVHAVLPMLADYRGTLCLTSSPGEVLAGLFYEADVGELKDQWSSHFWTLLDNPHFQRPSEDERFKTVGEEELNNIVMLQFGGNWDHPAFRREYLGEWVTNNQSLVYPHPIEDCLDTLPKWHNEEYGIGMDLGSATATAITVVKFSEYERKVAFVESWSESGLLVDEMALELKKRIDKYNPVYILADTGGLGKVPVEEFRRRYRMPIHAAEKTDKSFNQRVMANDMLSHYILADKQNCANLIKQWRTVVKDEEGQEIRGQVNHESDAALYIYRKIYNTYLKSFKPPKSEEDLMIEHFTSRSLDELQAQNQEDFYQELY